MIVIIRDPDILKSLNPDQVKSYLRSHHWHEPRQLHDHSSVWSMSQKEDIMETMTSWEEKGMEKDRQTIALNLLRQWISIEAIAQPTVLTLSQLQEMGAKLS